VKRGIFELVDLVLVNKDDGEMRAAAAKSVSAARGALSLTRPRAPGWKIPVLSCSALEERGIAEAWKSLLECREYLDEGGYLQGRRADQARAWMWAETAESLLSSLRNHPLVKSSVPTLEAIVSAGELTPPSAARRLLEVFLPPADGRLPEADGIGRLNHVAVAVPDLGSAVGLYRDLLGAAIAEPQELPEHGVRVAFVPWPGIWKRIPPGGSTISATKSGTSGPPPGAFERREPGSWESPEKEPTASPSSSSIRRTSAALS
jgi:hypothetical protein